MLFSPHEDNIMLMMPGEQHKGKEGLEIAKNGTKDPQVLMKWGTGWFLIIDR
jgi:hypothetical protein